VGGRRRGGAGWAPSRGPGGGSAPPKLGPGQAARQPAGHGASLHGTRNSRAHSPQPRAPWRSSPRRPHRPPAQLRCRGARPGMRLAPAPTPAPVAAIACCRERMSASSGPRRARNWRERLGGTHLVCFGRPSIPRHSSQMLHAWKSATGASDRGNNRISGVRSLPPPPRPNPRLPSAARGSCECPALPRVPHAHGLHSLDSPSRTSVGALRQALSFVSADALSDGCSERISRTAGQQIR